MAEIERRPWILRRDPLPEEEGGIRPGATFTASELSTTLKLGNWTPGTRFTFEGKTYTVYGKYYLVDRAKVYYRSTGNGKGIEPTDSPVKPRIKKRASTQVLTEEKVRQIRREYTGARGEVKALAKEYGITLAAMLQIVTRKTWRDI